MFKKIFSVLMFLVFSAMLILGIWYLTKTNGWPLWVGISIFVGSVGFILSVVFLKRYLLRRNEKKFVKRVIAKEGDAIFATEKESSLLIKDLESQWEKSIQILYASKLSKGKNPIYALPWIMVIGESGAGKTSLIKNSRLSSAITDSEVSAGLPETKNCNWWFFEDAIILDTAGRYTISIDEHRDNAEWERFLSLLTKYRKEEPLNGVVITISVERLLENDNNLIQEEALSIRKRIDQLMISIGAKFPVYLMISKMDYIYGFTNFCEALPKELQNQAMGYLNESLNQNWDEVIYSGIDFIKQKITTLQILLIEQNPQQAKEILLFSKEFDRIVLGLENFSSIVFGDNPYQKIPMLRGIYFSSALNDGKSNSSFLKEFELSQNTQKVKNKAYFIKDFFKVILPSDRNIFTPIKEYLSWQKRNYKLAVSAWMLVFISLMGIYTYSYFQNIKVISDVKYVKEYNKNFKKMDLTARVIAINELLLAINKIHKLNQNVLFPFLKFEQSQKAEKDLKNLFRHEFNNYLYRKFEFKMDQDIENITTSTPSNEVVSYMGFFIDSIDVLNQVLEDKKDIEVSKRFSIWIKNILFKEESKIDASVSFLFIKNYIAYQKFNNNKDLVKEEISFFQDLMSKVVHKKGSNLHWLTDEGVSQTPNITISDFYRGIDESLVQKFPVISGSLTMEGRKNLIINIKVLEKSIGKDKDLEDNLNTFWTWYDNRFYYRWKNFAMSFKNADKLLKSKNKEQLLYAMSSDQNPDFIFIHTMAKEFNAYKALDKVPAWSKLVINLDKIMSIAKNIRESKNSLISEVNSETNKLVAKAQSKIIDKDGYIKLIKSAGLLNNYISSLTKLSIVVDKKQSKMLITNFFSTNVNKISSDASFTKCYNNYKKFIHSLAYYENSNFIYDIMGEPKNYIINYSISEMKIILNDEWQNSVVGSIPLSTNHNLLMSLFNKDKGLVWKYVNNDLKPFIKLDQYGYAIKTVLGYKLDIKPSFLRYLNSGINLLSAYKPKYNIAITALPFDVNNDAKTEPNYVNLHLRCAKSDYILKNENYNLTKEFNWVPSKCGDTIITFGFDNFKVKKTYEGEDGFLYFLKDFRTGTKVFKVKDFDKVAPELKQKGITSIKVSYNISNEGYILKLLDKTPYDIPKNVIDIKR